MSAESEYIELLNNADCVSEAIIDALSDTDKTQHSMTLAVYLQQYIKSSDGSYIERIIGHDMAHFLVTIVTESMRETANDLNDKGDF